LKGFPHRDYLRMIHREQHNRDPSDLSQRPQFGSIPEEVLVPLVLPWAEEPCDHAALLVDPSHVGSLEAIAMNRGQGQILKFSFAPVLARNYMIYLEWRWMELLR